MQSTERKTPSHHGHTAVTVAGFLCDALLLFSDLLRGGQFQPPLPQAREGSLVPRRRCGSLLPLVYSFPPLILPEGGHMVECSESGPRAGAALSPGTVQRP